jgi:hypothetical protein
MIVAWQELPGKRKRMRVPIGTAEVFQDRRFYRRNRMLGTNPALSRPVAPSVVPLGRRFLFSSSWQFLPGYHH